MTTRSRGPGAGFRWLSQGIGSVFRHPKALLGGALFLALANLVPVAISLSMQWKTLLAHQQPAPANMLWLTPVSVLLYLLLVPVYAGYMQVIDAAERGEPTRGSDIFKPYRNGEAMRLIGYGLAMMLLYVCLFGLVILTVGRDVGSWYLHLAEASRQAMPLSLPAHFGTTMALFVVAGLYVFAVYAISLCQVALDQRGVFGAIGDGLVGALKNVLPLVVLLLSGLVALLVLLIAMAILFLVVGLVGALVGPWLLYVLMAVVYVGVMLLMFAIQFGTQYQVWRDVCADDGEPAAMPTVAA